MDLAEVEKFEQQVGTLKLSQAIRIGAKMRPQCRGHYLFGGGTCALGAAWEALGRNPRMGMIAGRLEAEYHLPSYVTSNIIYKNDTEHKTREEIADWLESQGF